MMREYCYNIGGVGYEFLTDKKIVDYSPYDIFRVEKSALSKDRHTYYFCEGEYSLPEGSVLLSSTPSADIYETQDSYVHINKRFDEKNYECIVVAPKDRAGGHFYFTNGGYEKLKVTAELFRSCNFVSSLLFYDAVILHSSYIIYNNKAILFSANSEGGKSTQAALWQQYRGAEIINGDRSVLKKEKDGWYVHSLPLCGSSGICKQKSAPLEAIVFVNKDKNNSVEPLSNAQKLSLIMPQLTFENYKDENYNKLFNLVDDLIYSQKIVKLNCRIDEEATEVLRKEIEADE
ncbi:MAG: hypothetical protein MJ147_10040 [Clostridia bacterium]|nr:hypothetical protein [Clostridia bacterium]